MALRGLADKFPEVIKIADVVRSIHRSWKDGVLLDGKVDNDQTLELLRDQVLSWPNLEQMGCLSDMMDGRVGVIRDTLESNGFVDTVLLSYAANMPLAFMDHLEKQ